VIWSWISFASGYVVGGMSGILVLGVFIAGGKGEAAVESARPPELKAHNSVVKFDVVHSARNAAPALRQPATNSLSNDSSGELGYSPD
jgi:hypothetical protein